ncbi:MAG TPA: hypothetical protein VFM14_13195 [Gemmatimonadales bacterium]|nr:hypothetical protein [Gemmatimonadales bacterium]
MDTIIPPSLAATTTLTQDRTVAIVSYITIVGLIVAIVMHMNSRTELGAFHVRQMLGLALTNAAASVLWVVPVLGWIVWLVPAFALLLLWIIGLFSAIKGEMQPVPIVGTHYQRWLAGVFA